MTESFTAQLSKPWRATDTAVRKGQFWEVGVCAGKGDMARTVCRVIGTSSQEALDRADEVAEAINSIRRMKGIMRMAGLDEDRLLADMIKERKHEQVQDR